MPFKFLFLFKWLFDYFQKADRIRFSEKLGARKGEVFIKGKEDGGRGGISH